VQYRFGLFSLPSPFHRIKEKRNEEEKKEKTDSYDIAEEKHFLKIPTQKH